ncbi:MAG: hypothetical protein ABIV63_07195 [Caldimonas sp.]
MRRSARLTQWTLHVAVFALMLKAAVPLLASAAAQLQGKATADVCDVYGVALPGRTTTRAHGTNATAGRGEAPANATATAAAAGLDANDPHAAHRHMAHQPGHAEPGALLAHAPPDAQPDPPTRPGDHPTDSHGLHHGDHCALTGLAALAPPHALAPPVDDVPPAFEPLAPTPPEPPRDAVARWASLLDHGPPRAA